MRGILFAIVAVMIGWGNASAQTTGESSPMLTPDGAWCWFQDPRAVYVDTPCRRTFAQWVTRTGSLMIGAYDHDTGEIQTHELKEEWDVDDHNAGSILVLPDNRLLVFYARHNKTGLFARKSLNPGDINRWGDEIIVSKTPRITYSHPAYLAGEERFYVFWRGPSWKPTFATSPDGVHWSESRILLQDEGRADTAIRPYTKITSDGISRIHIAFTDGHPRNEPQNSIYYLRYESGRFYRADGSVAGDMDSLPVAHTRSDLVYDAAETDVRAWVWDVAADGNGNPVIAYTRFPSETDHRYHYARWTGDRWADTEITAAGPWFPQTLPGTKETETYYSAGIALDHADPSTVYLSRPVDGVFEIERWTTPDRGRTWRSAAVTTGSRYRNVRPVVPPGAPAGAGHVLWMNGQYVHYTFYRTSIRFAAE